MTKTKILLLCLALACLWACQSDGEAPGKATLRIEATLPSALATRAFSDGTLATQLHWAVYEAGSTTLVLSGTKEMTGLSTELSLTLLQGTRYDVVLVALSDDTPHKLNLAQQTLTVAYGDASDDNADAFYTHLTIEDVSKESSLTATLTRPFAQINFGTSDAQSSAVADNHALSAMTFELSVPAGLYQTLNLMTGEASDAVSSVSLTAQGTPDEEFPVDAYDYLLMAYVLVGTEKTVLSQDVCLTVSGGEGDDKRALSEAIVISVPSMPLQRNYRTNVYGTLLTDPTSFTLTIDPAYEGEADVYFEPIADEWVVQSSLPSIVQEDGGSSNYNSWDE